MKNDKFSPRSILIVEAHPLLKLLTAYLVADAGFIALQASNADEALAILESRSGVALLLTSIKMTGSMDGLELTRAVTERRVLEREKDGLLQDKGVLLEELQHRVANSLQIIAAS